MNEIQNEQMKMINSPCCGSYSKRKVVKEKESIPPNPKINGGIALIYVGSGKKSFTGKATGAIYYVSDHMRHFNAHKEDADDILRNPAVIRKP